MCEAVIWTLECDKGKKDFSVVFHELEPEPMNVASICGAKAATT